MVQISVRRPKRWDVAFAEELDVAEMSEEIADEILANQLKSLSEDSARFPPSLQLSEIIMNDCRIRHFQEGEVVVREGDYGSSAFVVLEGSVLVTSGTLSEKILGRREHKKASLWGGFKNILGSKSKYPEVRSTHHTPSRLGDKPLAIPLQDFPNLFSPKKGGGSAAAGIEIGEGEIFGEIAALGRSARTATVLAAPKGVRLLEIRWQGLRDIRKYSSLWQKMIEERYRNNSLRHHLENTFPTNVLSFEKSFADPDSTKESGELISEFEWVSRSTQFQTYGEYDWYGTYREAASGELSDRIQKEPLIVGEGEHPAGLYIILSGFVRVSIKYNKGEKTLAYIGKGSTFGLAELYANWSAAKTPHPSPPIGSEANIRAIGYTEVLFIPAPMVEKYVFHKLKPEEIPHLIPPQQTESNLSDGLASGKDDVLEFLVQERAINGTSTMLIDMDRCTRCDDCVRACANTHSGNPRFIRHGKQEKGIQLVHACMHCVDPLCMIGCPTGAIHRDQTGKQIVINDYTCIGCATCANNCPYDNIQMTDVRFPNGDPYPGIQPYDNGNLVQRLEIEKDFVRKATKCDLCETLTAGPACERACPHDALTRVDLSIAHVAKPDSKK